MTSKFVYVLKNVRKIITYKKRASFIEKIYTPSNFEELTIDDGFFIIFKENAKEISVNSTNDSLLKEERILPTNIPKNRIIYGCPCLTGEKFIASVTNAKLIGTYPIGFTKSNRLIYHTIDNNHFDSRIWAALESELIRTGIRNFNKNLNNINNTINDEACLLFSKWNHYGHWLPEHVLKLQALEKFRQITGRKVKIILENNPPSWKISILNKLDYFENDIIHWNEEPIILKNLIVPSYPEASYDSFIWLKHKLLKGISAYDHKRIYISRSKCLYGRVINEKDLFPLLSKLEFTIINPEDYSPIEQARLFSNSKLIIGPHGSGFTNIIFAEKAKIIEFHGIEVRLFAYKLSLVMGHSYIPFFAKPLHKGKGRGNMYIDPLSLKTMLEKII